MNTVLINVIKINVEQTHDLILKTAQPFVHLLLHPSFLHTILHTPRHTFLHKHPPR
jgi:hypothetical protein